MLLERKELLEHELRKARQIAAAFYVNQVVLGEQCSEEDSAEYNRLVEKISGILQELSTIREMIENGETL